MKLTESDFEQAREYFENLGEQFNSSKVWYIIQSGKEILEWKGKAEKWDNRGHTLQKLCDMNKPNAQKMSDDIHDSFVSTVQEVQEDNEKLEQENKQLKTDINVMKNETKQDKQLIYELQNIKQKLEKVKPIIKDEWEMWTGLTTVGEPNAESLKEIFQKLTEILDSKEKK